MQYTYKIKFDIKVKENYVVVNKQIVNQLS